MRLVKWAGFRFDDETSFDEEIGAVAADVDSRIKASVIVPFSCE